MKRRVLFATYFLLPVALLLPVLTPLGANVTGSKAIRQKFEQIKNRQAKPGSIVTLGEPELNAYLNEESKALAKEGIRNPKVNLASGKAIGSATVNFLKLKTASGEEPGWLLRQLLDGERKLDVTARLDSKAGRATVYLEKVAIDGIDVSGKPLDYLLNHYLKAYYPKAKVGEPFDLDYEIQRIDLKPETVAVVIAK